MFEERFGDKTKAIQLARELAKTHGYFATTAVATLLHHGEEEFVVRLKPSEPSAILARAILLTQFPYHQAEAITVSHEWLKSEFAETVLGRPHLLVLLLLSKQNDLATIQCKKWLADFDEKPTVLRLNMWRPVFEEVLGIQEEGSLIIYPNTQSRILFFRALMAYSQNDLQQAIQLLEEFNRTPDLSEWSYWGVALAKRWEAVRAEVN